MNRSTVISVLILVIHSAFAKDANERALDIDGGRELKGKSSGSKSGKSRRNLDVNGAHVFDGDRELKGKSSKGSKSRRALDGENELEFDEVELYELDVDRVETIVFEGNRELKGKSSGSKSGKSRRNLDVNGAHVLDGNRELKGSGSKSGKSSGSKSGKSRRALELHESELEFEDIDLDELEFEGLLP